MLPKVVILSIIFLISQVNQCFAFFSNFARDETTTIFKTCFNNKALEVKIGYDMCRVDEAPSECSDGYLLTPGIGCHKISTVRKSWNSAREHCLSENAHLAIVDSTEEYELLVRLMEKNKLGLAWLGVHNLFNSKDAPHTIGWTTVKGEPMLFDKWLTTCTGTKQPDNGGDDEHCVTIQPSGCPGGFNDYKCTIEDYFICEKPQPHENSNMEKLPIFFGKVVRALKLN